MSARGCKEVRDDLYKRVIPAVKPNIIVASEFEYLYANADATTIRSVDQLTQDGRKLILIEDFPDSPFDPLGCLSQAKVLQQCRFVTNTTPLPLELLFRKLDGERSDVYSANFDQLVCPYLPICDPVVNGQIVRFDASHITAAFAKTIAPQVDAYLKQTVLPSKP